MEKNAVKINKKVAKSAKVLEIVGDIIVPDIKPDIVSVVNTNGIPYIYKEDVGNGKVKIDGNLDTYVVYLADNGETRSIQTTLSFSDNLENKQIKEGCYLKEKLTLEIIEAKVLNERKISIKANVGVQLEVFEKNEIEITSNFNEIEEVQKLNETVELKSLIGVNKVKTSVKEDISVDTTYSVAEILKTSIEITNIENKISYNKVLAKADANTKIIFLSEDGRIGIAEATIPVMSFIDIENVADGHRCEIDYIMRNMLFKVNPKEQHSIGCQIEFEVMCQVYEMQNIDVIQDMYGIRKNIKFDKKEILVPIKENSKNETVSITERIMVEDILNILDVTSNLKKINSTKSGNYYNCECEANMKIYYEADNRNGLNVKEITVPFMVKVDDTDEILLEIVKKQFTVSNENVNCELEILVRKTTDSEKNITVIENVECSECEDDLDYKMCIYFVKPGDTAWNLAKYFRVKMEDILSINNLESPEALKAGERIYIVR